MSAGFFRRAFSTFFDFVLVIAVIYGTYFLFGRSIIENQIPYFDELYEAFQEVNQAYNADNDRIRLEYDAQMELAGGDSTKETAALTRYTEQMALLDAQNLVDIEPYNYPLSQFFLQSIYYFAIGFLILMGIYTVLMKGQTLGRRILKLTLVGARNPLFIFAHDILLKYFIIVFTIIVSIYGGIIVFFLALLLDLTLITFTKSRSTLRDTLLKMSVQSSTRSYL